MHGVRVAAAAAARQDLQIVTRESEGIRLRLQLVSSSTPGDDVCAGCNARGVQVHTWVLTRVVHTSDIQGRMCCISSQARQKAKALGRALRMFVRNGPYSNYQSSVAPSLCDARMDDGARVGC